MVDWIETRKEFLLGMMIHHCQKYNITGWSLKFSDIKQEFDLDAGAICHKKHKTIYVDINHLGSKVAPFWHRDMFLHEFTHLLLFEQKNEVVAVGLDGYRELYSHHGRNFRKMARAIGTGDQAIPSYDEVYPFEQ
jgi:hypothetical protein